MSVEQVLEATTQFAPTAKTVCWMHHQLLFLLSGDLKEYKSELERHLVRLRVFDEKQELHVWRSAGKLKYRHRVDGGSGSDVHYSDHAQVLLGSRYSYHDGMLTASEDRGTLFELPFLDKAPKGRLKLVTRNYIDFNDLGQAGYVDCRFVNIKA